MSTGLSDTDVRRSPDGRAYAKSARTPEARRHLADERARSAWLTGTGIPGPRVLDWVETGDVATLVTSTVPGVPASDLAADAAGKVSDRAATAIGAALARLHALPPASCPFDARLAVLVPQARAQVAAGLVDATDFDVERLGRTAADVLTDLETRLDAMVAAEADDLVVCHGDLCLPNVLLDPDTLEVTGFVDLGLLGVSDRHRDLALLARSITLPGLNDRWGHDDVARVGVGGGRAAGPGTAGVLSAARRVLLGSCVNA